LFFDKFRDRRQVAVLTPPEIGNNSSLLPRSGSTNGRKWTYYDLCIRDWGRTKYFRVEDWERVRDFRYVFVHEGLFDALGPETSESLRMLKDNNGKVIWVELHEKSVFSGAFFQPDFFDTVDLVLKHQLIETSFLKDELSRTTNRLAPHAVYGKATYADYLGDRELFAFHIPPTLFDSHLAFDFDLAAKKIRPLMYPFSWALLEHGMPRYSEQQEKHEQALYSGRKNINHVQRHAFVAWLEDHGVPIGITEDYFSALRGARYFAGLGHIHSSLRTFDTLAFDTVLLHYGSGPYIMWPEFEAYVNFLPAGDVSRIFVPGGFGMDIDYLEGVAARLKADLGNEDLRQSILKGQRSLFDRLIDPKFIRSKLGIDE
jgi:hypothetical protein